MTFLGKIFSKINPIKIAADFVGGTLGNVLRIATTVVEGVAKGRRFGDIMKDVAKQVAVLAVKVAVTYFTGGTAGLFINKLIDGAQGILGKVAAKVASSTLLSKTVTEWVSNKITEFGRSLTTDLVRKQVTDLVLEATGLESADQQLASNQIDSQKLVEELVALLSNHVDRAFSDDDRVQTLYSLDPQSRMQFTDGFDA